MNRRRLENLAAGIAREARRIDRDSMAQQNIRILCPRRHEGLWCQWVAGHYGECVGSRYGPQQRLV